MIITNQTAVDYWFGPMHLPSGSGQTLDLDDTSDTSLYLSDDSVADMVNTLYQASPPLIMVTSYATPFPRPTGTPDVLHGVGAPEGMVYAPQGSLYLRRDNTEGTDAVYTKTTGVTYNTGWLPVATDAGQPMGLTGATAPTRYVGGTASGAPTSGAFAIGDFIIDRTGNVWICTTAGTPGTWTAPSGAATSWSPTLGGSTSNPNLGSTGGAAGGAHAQIGSVVLAQVTFNFAGSGIAQAAGVYLVDIPVAGRSGQATLGTWYAWDGSGDYLSGVVQYNGSWAFFVYSGGALTGSDQLTFVSGGGIAINLSYIT